MNCRYSVVVICDLLIPSGYRGSYRPATSPAIAGLPEISISIFAGAHRMSLPNAPFYRRWSFILAGVIGLAAITALLGWRGLQETDTPTASVTTVPPTTVASPPTTAPPTSLEPTSKPDPVLWDKKGHDTEASPGFRAPSTWHIEWSFDCSNFKKLGGGNFKITGTGAFGRVDIQEYDVKASGARTFSRGGFGHLQVDSVCKSWRVTALPG
jgi:hypothetical protein